MDAVPHLQTPCKQLVVAGFSSLQEKGISVQKAAGLWQESKN